MALFYSFGWLASAASVFSLLPNGNEALPDYRNAWNRCVKRSWDPPTRTHPRTHTHAHTHTPTHQHTHTPPSPQPAGAASHGLCALLMTVFSKNAFHTIGEALVNAYVPPCLPPACMELKPTPGDTCIPKFQ